VQILYGYDCFLFLCEVQLYRYIGLIQVLKTLLFQSRLKLLVSLSLNREQARLTQPALDALRRGSRLEIKKTLEKYIINEIENENINNRDDIIQSLQDIGFEIPRQGKSYITIHDTETDTRIRLKGAIYEQYWRTEQTLKTENRSEAERDRDFDTARATAAYNALEARKYCISPQLLPKMTIKTDIAIRVVFNHVSIDFYLRLKFCTV
jgi:hypothetical protein